jgi:FixJ family two-component response regulator
MTRQALVSVVDDDESVRESLPDLLGTFGFATKTFASAQEFLESDCIRATECLILDVAMPGMSGPELQRELLRRGYSIPTIFITARTDECVRSELLSQGAVDCLFKPFGDQALSAALEAALHKGRD